ncbi:methyl-accepting chemotaxis protein [Roseibium sp. RKSG952]|uniref:methyl-accepting chemotaxis protein n=1 Tax=Roseibium sp. RKSG952 TaxID=2529384 RepID=UPI0012BCB665|nr:HAMP domain-containing methyl-accepting chemotaxis protein [Roseibium sp. RKSG952]MTH97866.1 HAMP domain-containing protein [Roseibium sp. RKSG952]
MHLFKRANDIKFGKKVGGGFAAMVALTAVVSGIGALAVRNLSEKVEVTGYSTTAISTLQNVAGSRENYLSSLDERAAEDAFAELGDLTGHLDLLARDLHNDPDSLAVIADARTAIADFRSVFETMLELTSQQNQRRILLEAVLANLEKTAGSIASAAGSERRKFGRQVVKTRETLFLANKVGQAASGFQEEALTLQNLFNEAANSPAKLAEVKDRASAMVPLATEIAEKPLEGVDPAGTQSLAELTQELVGQLEELVTTKDYIKVFDLTDAVKASFANIDNLTKTIRTQANDAVDTAYREAEDVTQSYNQVDGIADQAVRVKAEAISIKAATLAFLLSPNGQTEAAISAGLKTVKASETKLLEEAANYPAIAARATAIGRSLTSYEKAFGDFAAGHFALLENEDQLKTYENMVRQIISGIAAEQEIKAQASGQQALLTIALTLFLAVASAAALAFAMNLAVTRPIRKTTDVMSRLADGDVQIDIGDTKRRDEIGDMNRTVEIFRDNAVARARLEDETAREQEKRQAHQERIEALISDFRTKATDVLAAVGNTAAGLDQTAHALTGIASESSGHAGQTLSATDEATQNVQTVASASEELAASIGEISRQVSKTNEIVDRATAGTRETNTKVESLAAAASKIGEVVSLIQAIAEQTNLLALNATIEAARAGDAGRGFAVVASEVKELATQTSKATEEISGQISEIQSATDESVSAIADILKIMEEVNSYASAIAAAVEQQGAATTEISDNIQRAAEGTGQVKASMNQLSLAVGQTSQSADMVLSASGDLSAKTDQLKTEVEHFLTEVAAS